MIGNHETSRKDSTRDGFLGFLNGFLSSGMARAGLVFIVLLLLLSPFSARALDAFEIQVYDGTANAPCAPALELHANHVFSGLHSAPSPEAPAHHQTHLTLESSLGITPFWEMGAYLQTAFLGDGGYDYAGAKLRSKFVSPPGWNDHLRIGANVEVSFMPDRFDQSRQAIELRPILAWENNDWLFATNPIVGLSLGRPGWSEGPTFEPSVMALYKWRELFSAGLEYYSALGAFGSGFSRLSQQEHYLFEVINFIGIKHVEFNVGIGEGLTYDSNPVTAKLIVGYEWEKD
jgi:hypothetical protein